MINKLTKVKLKKIKNKIVTRMGKDKDGSWRFRLRLDKKNPKMNMKEVNLMHSLEQLQKNLKGT